MSRTHKPGHDQERNTRELLDAYFDGDLDRAGKARLHEALREDHLLAEEFSRTSEAVSMLRQSASNTRLDVDLSERVLAQCEASRGYLNKRGRRFVLAGRSAVAMATLALAAGVVAWVRLTPPELRLPESQRPLGVLLESGNTDAANLRLVPPSVQQDLADSIDQSKIERTIVYGLPADPASSFSAFGQETEPSRTGAVARLPLLARSGETNRSPANAWPTGPLPMERQTAASVVRGPDASGWWNRPAPSSATVTLPGGRPRHFLFLRHSEPTILDLLEAERDRE